MKAMNKCHFVRNAIFLLSGDHNIEAIGYNAFMVFIGFTAHDDGMAFNHFQEVTEFIW
jgi:hypothetical protein